MFQISLETFLSYEGHDSTHYLLNRVDHLWRIINSILRNWDLIIIPAAAPIISVCICENFDIIFGTDIPGNQTHFCIICFSIASFFSFICWLSSNFFRCHYLFILLCSPIFLSPFISILSYFSIFFLFIFVLLSHVVFYCSYYWHRWRGW